MKAVIQRVSSASVEVEGKIIGSCNKGYMMANDGLIKLNSLIKCVCILAL